MHKAYIVTGTLTDAHTVTLDEALPLKPVKVRLVVEPITAPTYRTYQDVIAVIRERQGTRGHQPPTREEIDFTILRFPLREPFSGRRSRTHNVPTFI